MPVSITLAQAAKLSQDMLVKGVIRDVITVNQFYQILPFQAIEGNALTYNRESTLGDVMTATVGTEITANAAATWTQVSSSLTTIIGKAAINGLIQATRSNYTDQAQAQIASKAKSVGRKYQDMLINGDSGSVATEFDGIASLVSAGQTISATATDGDVLTLRKLDDALSMVTAKDGEVDYIMMNVRDINTYMDILRGMGGASIDQVVTLPSGVQIPAYRGTPIFRNDWIGITDTQGDSTNASAIYMGTLDDGSMSNGIAGLTAMGDAGIRIEGPYKEPNYDEEYYHVKFYSGLANFSDKGLVAITGIIPA